MIIGVAGPYSADSEEKRQANLEAMNFTAARLLEKGHIPLIGMNAALPVVSVANLGDGYKATMEISLAVINACEAILIIGDSPGVRKEKALIEGKGLPIYYDIVDVPDADPTPSR